jgi:hypothetical protein
MERAVAHPSLLLTIDEVEVYLVLSRQDATSSEPEQYSLQ